MLLFICYRERRITLKALEAVKGSSLCSRRINVKRANFGWSQKRLGGKVTKNSTARTR